MDKKTIDYKEHYKENAPEDTVKKLISILDENGIEVEENWMEESEIGTNSLRLTIKGTNIGTNGKGISKKYARASAYAEFFERFQNDLLWGDQWCSSLNSSPDEVVKSAQELVDENSTFLEYYFKIKGLKNATKIERINNIIEMEKVEEFATDKQNHFTTTPFYNISLKRIEYLPKTIYMPYYGSNGMCAGNTREEALVQGLSEIIERLVQKRVFEEKVTFPDIPENQIKKYPYIWDMYEKLKGIESIEAKLKDCSFGGKYPVVALLVVQKNTGFYGVKFGCHPIISIAMERALTEATQGQKIIQYSKSSKLDFTNQGVGERYNIENSIKVGIAQYPYQFLGDKATFDYVEPEDLSKYSNAQLLNRWIDQLSKEGYNVLIRDASCLDFPAYHIIIPGVSEMREISDAFLRGYNSRMYASWLLGNLDQINRENSKYISGAVEKYAMNIQENNIKDYFGNINGQRLPAEEINSESSFLCAMCYCMQGKYGIAEHYAQKTAKEAVERKSKEVSFYIAIQYYISAMKKWNDHDTAVRYLNKLFDDQLIELIDEKFQDRELIIQKMYGYIKYRPKREGIEYMCLKKLKEIKKSKLIRQEELESLLTVS